jgi:hypothetical protein
MACHELPSAAQDHVAVDDVRRRAAVLAGQMTDWLNSDLFAEALFEGLPGPVLFASDVLAGLESARDVLEELACG